MKSITVRLVPRGSFVRFSIILLTAAMFALSSGMLQGQARGAGRPAFQPAEAAQIKALIDNYFEGFTAKDYQKFPQFFQVPFLNLRNGRPAVQNDLGEVLKSYEHIRDSLDHTDYAVSKPEQIRITALSADSALVNILWRRYKKDGSLLNDGAEFYVACKSSGQWKLCGNIGQEMDQFAKVY